MFGRKKESVKVAANMSGKFDTLLGPQVKMTGTITGKGALRIEGELDGEIDYDGDVVVGEKALVKAVIKATNITVAGRVEGNIDVSGRLELVSSGQLVGDMSAGTFVVAEGALFQGKSDMERSGGSDSKRTSKQQGADAASK